MAAAVSAKLVKELRDKTGAGMMDCKKALAATVPTISVVATAKADLLSPLSSRR